MNYNYAIIEQDPRVVDELLTFFNNQKAFSCIGISSEYDDSLDTILKYQPNLVFLNLDNFLDRKRLFNGFCLVNDLYKYLSELPLIIGLSETKAYAYESIKHNFFDYILKPINVQELRKILMRLNKRRPITESKKLCLKSYKDFRFINIDDILFLKADNNTTEFFMEDNSVVNAYKTLKTYELLLPDNFVRIHKSYIINKNFISRINFGKSKFTIKKNSFQIPFSKSYKDKVAILERSLSKKSLISLN